MEIPMDAASANGKTITLHGSHKEPVTGTTRCQKIRSRISIPKEATMLLFKLFLVSALIAIGTLSSVEAADMETRLIDKNCWIEVFEDSKYDAKDPHVQLQGPQEYATLNNLNGKDWNNDIESVIVGQARRFVRIKGGTSKVGRSPSLLVSACPTFRSWVCPMT
jgi:hypothetical protein